jgi:hypothetical protein
MGISWQLASTWLRGSHSGALRLLREPLCMYVQREYTSSLSVFLSLYQFVSIFLSFLFLLSNKTTISCHVECNCANVLCALGSLRLELDVTVQTLQGGNRVMLGYAFGTLAVMYLQRGPPTVKNKPTTNGTHRMHRMLAATSRLQKSSCMLQLTQLNGVCLSDYWV